MCEPQTHESRIFISYILSDVEKVAEFSGTII